MLYHIHCGTDTTKIYACVQMPNAQMSKCGVCNIKGCTIANSLYRSSSTSVTTRIADYGEVLDAGI